MANFKPLTRYTNGKFSENRSGTKFAVLRGSLNLEPKDDDIFVTINQNLKQRPDLIAFYAYGNSDLWWVIYEFNNINDPLFGMSLGQILRIPNKNRVIAAINELGKV